MSCRICDKSKSDVHWELQPNNIDDYVLIIKNQLINHMES